MWGYPPHLQNYSWAHSYKNKREREVRGMEAWSWRGTVLESCPGMVGGRQNAFQKKLASLYHQRHITWKHSTFLSSGSPFIKIRDHLQSQPSLLVGWNFSPTRHCLIIQEPLPNKEPWQKSSNCNLILKREKFLVVSWEPNLHRLWRKTGCAVLALISTCFVGFFFYSNYILWNSKIYSQCVKSSWRSKKIP